MNMITKDSDFPSTVITELRIGWHGSCSEAKLKVRLSVTISSGRIRQLMAALLHMITEIRDMTVDICVRQPTRSGANRLWMTAL